MRRACCVLASRRHVADAVSPHAVAGHSCDAAPSAGTVSTSSSAGFMSTVQRTRAPDVRVRRLPADQRVGHFGSRGLYEEMVLRAAACCGGNGVGM